MNIHAIQHRANAGDAYAIAPERVAIRLRTARGDLSRGNGAVTLVTIDKYRYIFSYSDWHHDEFHDVPMRHIASDQLFDYYEAIVDHDVLALSYYFRLEGNGQRVCYGRGHLFAEEDVSMAHLFTMPYPEPEDLFLVPDWLREAVVYQIFPDTFYRGNGQTGAASTRDRYGDWHRPAGDGSFLGGTLQGIIDKLPYLDDLGANTLYLTPIFASSSYHRYNVADYYRVDPILGSNDTLVALVAAAHRRGMRVILDAVVHATGLEFFAFQDLLANGARSRYRDWYHVGGFPLRLSDPPNYRAWAYHHRLPKVNLANPEARAYMLDVLEHWIRETDIDGWRMDTCDETSHAFWQEARRRIKAAKPDALLAGEVWYDARPWLAGDQFDTVMNYGFREPVLRFFARDALTPEAFSQQLGWLRGRYRRQAWQVMWNLLGSHDTERFLAEAGGDVRRLKLAALFQFTYPGVPFVYYGDEVGMSQGYRDGMRWTPASDANPSSASAGSRSRTTRAPAEAGERVSNAFDMPDATSFDGELLAFYRRLAALRREHPALARGTFREVLVDNSKGLYGFRRALDGQTLDVYVNNSDEPRAIRLAQPATNVLDQGCDATTELRLRPRSGAVLQLQHGASGLRQPE